MSDARVIRLETRFADDRLEGLCIHVEFEESEVCAITYCVSAMHMPSGGIFESGEYKTPAEAVAKWAQLTGAHDLTGPQCVAFATTLVNEHLAKRRRA